MAENGLRQLGEPRISIFAEILHPEPLHLEINSWQHLLNIIYHEAVRRGRYSHFDTTLRSPQQVTEKDGSTGWGLKYIASRIQEQYDKLNNRMKKLYIRLIGSHFVLIIVDYHMCH